MRFNWWRLSGLIEASRRAAAKLEKGELEEEARAQHRQTGELLKLRAYPLAFLLLVYYGVLVLVGAPTTLLLGAAFLAALWRSPIVRAPHRHTISTLASMAASAAFVPPLSLWTTGGVAGSGRWSWDLDWQLLVHILLPGIMFGTTLLASGSRPLWLCEQLAQERSLGRDALR
jgi:hypothetical protein